MKLKCHYYQYNIFHGDSCKNLIAASERQNVMNSLVIENVVHLVGWLIEEFTPAVRRKGVNTIRRRQTYRFFIFLEKSYLV